MIGATAGLFLAMLMLFGLAFTIDTGGGGDDGPDSSL
jgi:hypothetical protein